MYSLVATFIRSYDRSVGVRQIDASNMNIREVVSSNAEVYFILTNTFLSGQMTLDASAVYPQIFAAPPNLTVTQWLSFMGNVTLPTTPGTLKVTEHRAKTMDAFQAGFTVFASTGYTGSDNPSNPVELREHVVLKKANVDYVDMRKHTLATVNGYFHLTDSDPTGYYVRDAANSMKVGGSPKVNLISLANVGEVQCVPLTQCDLTPRNQVDLYKGITITTDVSLVNKTVWLSVAGHLLFLNRNYQVVGEHSLYLDWRSLNMKKKYMTAKKFMDLSPVDAAMSITEQSDGIISRMTIDTDLVIRSFLHLSQSFLIIIDNPTVSVDIERIEDAGVIGKYFMYRNPHRLLLSNDGRAVPFTVINERKAFVISTSVEQGMSPVYLSDGLGIDQMPLYTKQLDPARPHRRVALHALDIRTTKLETV